MSKVSIIIPVYNVEKYLSQCLNSVVNQTLEDIEIICINDCSTDTSLDMINEYAQNDSRIVVIDLKENHGQGYCRNYALDRAKGEYIMFLDSDDWLDLKACEIAYNQISANKNDFVMFNYKKYLVQDDKFYGGTDFKGIFKEKINDKSLNPSELNSNFTKNCFSTCRIYNAEFLNKNDIRYADLRFNQDNVFVFNSIVSAKSISVVDKPLYFYRIHNSSTCFNPKHWKFIIPARMESYNLLKKKNANERIMTFFVTYSIKTVFRWYNHFIKINKSIKKELFYEVKTFFNLLSKEVDIASLKDELNNDSIGSYRHFQQITKYDYTGYIISRFLTNLFSINTNSKIIYINFLGIKTRIKKK